MADSRQNLKSAIRRKCFIICPLGEKQSETRSRSDKLLNHVLEPVLLRNDYDAVRADQIPKVGFITTQIINLVVESELVIADLTGSNPNVFYELALRHASQKPYIQLVESGAKIPFDISGIRTISIDMSDLDSVEQAKKEIEAQIKEFEKGHQPDSPVSIASVARMLRGDSAFAEKIAERISAIGSIGNGNWYPHEYDESKKIDEIYRRVWGLSDWGLVSLEQLDSKLDEVLSALHSLSLAKEG